MDRRTLSLGYQVARTAVRSTNVDDTRLRWQRVRTRWGPPTTVGKTSSKASPAQAHSFPKVIDALAGPGPDPRALAAVCERVYQPPPISPRGERANPTCALHLCEFVIGVLC